MILRTQRKSFTNELFCKIWIRSEICLIWHIVPLMFSPLSGSKYRKIFLILSIFLKFQTITIADTVVFCNLPHALFMEFAEHPVIFYKFLFLDLIASWKSLIVNSSLHPPAAACL